MYDTFGKARNCGFARLRSYDVVESVVKIKFMELGHKSKVDEFMEEIELLYKGMRELVVGINVEAVLEAVEKRGLPFICWIPMKKAELLQFQLDDNSYNMQLYNVVCKACSIDTSDMDEVFEDYQVIYDKTVEMQRDKEVRRKEGGRGRGALSLFFYVGENILMQFEKSKMTLKNRRYLI